VTTVVNQLNESSRNQDLNERFRIEANGDEEAASGTDYLKRGMTDNIEKAG